MTARGAGQPSSSWEGRGTGAKDRAGTQLPAPALCARIPASSPQTVACVHAKTPEGPGILRVETQIRFEILLCIDGGVEQVATLETPL
jgi:hypothetical protein